MFFFICSRVIITKKCMISNICNIQKCKIEPPPQKREIPQCAGCQRYGHTKKYCSRLPRCVKCNSNHWTSTCDKDKDVTAKEERSDPKCVLCTKNHPANYKGCSVFKEIQKRKFPPLRSRFERRDIFSQPDNL